MLGLSPALAATGERTGYRDGLAVEPLAVGSRDTDGNRTFGTGLGVDLPVGRGVRLGVQSLRTLVEDDVSRGIVDEARLRVTVRPVRTLRIEASAGGARLAPPMGAPSVYRWIGDVRSRWRATGGSPALEFRLARAPLVANTLLLGSHAMRSDARFGVELPMRALRLRGTVRGARIESAGEHNDRRQVDAALALRLSRAITPFVQYRSLGYLHAANTGYFAPQHVEIVESGSSFEIGSGSPWLLSMELGAGIQRIEPFGEPRGAWGPALRGYGYLSYAVGGGCELWLEAENENSPGITMSASEDWRYSSLSFALRWTLP
jgi:hypothetical protein